MGVGNSVVADSEIGTHADEDNRRYYGGALVCESVRTPENARLIAMAPEMYDVIKTLVLVAHGGNVEHARLFADENSPAVDAAREIVRKVEGAA